MNENRQGAIHALTQARIALQNKDRLAARHWAFLAADLAPELEDVWLILAAISTPRASQAYLNRALEINPSSMRARRGMHWNVRRLRTISPANRPPTTPIIPSKSSQVVHPHHRPIFLWVSLVVIFAALILLSGILPLNNIFPGWSSAFLNPVLTVFAQIESAPQALIGLLIPSSTPTSTATFTPTSTYTFTPTSTSTFTPTSTYTATQTSTPTDTATPTATNTKTPKPTRTPAPTKLPTKAPINPPSAEVAIPDDIEPGQRWVDVNLTLQTAYALEGNQVIESFLVSTGTYSHPTVTGQFHIYVKYLYSDMSGPGYYLPDVPYVMYFYQGYGLHGTYWHHNFGYPMSHGCVNLETSNAEWLFYWTSLGTLVNIHY